MRKLFVLITFFSVIILNSCHKNQAGSLTLKFNPMFGSSNFVLGRVYAAPDGKYYNFTKLSLYLSHIRLVRANGTMTEVMPLRYIKVSDSTTLSFALADSSGSFTGIQFGIGMDSVQDNVDPISVSDPNLAEAVNDEMYWSPNLKYVFVELEGQADTVPNPQAISGIKYHVGTNPYYTTVSLNKTFTTSLNNTTNIILSADLQKIFYGTNAINILVTPGSQTTDLPAVAQTFITDFSQSFSMSVQ